MVANHTKTLAVLFIEGYVSIGIEILILRQLLPVVGGNIIVTSLVIGIFLLFLALGYHYGGKQQGALADRLAKNFLLASGWLGIGLSYILIATFFYYTNSLQHVPTIATLIVYLLLVLAPLIFLLGQTVPITMNLFNHSSTTGAIGGLSLSISTLGSFCGATLTAIVLMQFFGVAWTVLLNSILLIGLYILLSQTKAAFIKRFVIGFILFGFIYAVNLPFEHKLFLTTNNYANYQLLTPKSYPLKPDEKILAINNSLSSFTDKTGKGFPYIESIKTILFSDLKLSRANILVLGAGGFSLTTNGTQNNNVTYVDIDKHLKKIAVPNFIAKINGHMIADDARHYIHFNKIQYQAIVIDVYSNVHSIPAYLLTQEFFTDIKLSLTEKGTAIFNIIANPTLSDSYSKHIDNTLRGVFRNCMTKPMHFLNAYTNILYICTKDKNEIDDGIYTDNLNAASLEA